jgi:hypothetical protein
MVKRRHAQRSALGNVDNDDDDVNPLFEVHFTEASILF